MKIIGLMVIIILRTLYIHCTSDTATRKSHFKQQNCLVAQRRQKQI